jgi:hypothetical protein
MSVLPRSRWQEWAREWGLAHDPQKGWLHPNERVTGERKGLLVRVGWGPQENPGLVTCIRFPRVTDPERLRQALIADDTLDVLPGQGAARKRMSLDHDVKKVYVVGRPPEFILSDRSLIWRRVFPWKAPEPAQLASWVDALVAAVARATPVFDGRCESCGTGVVRRYVLADDVPAMLCTSCQQRIRSESDLADRTYDMTEVRHIAGASRAFMAAMAGAVLWAAIGALTNHVFAAAAIGIGALIAWAYRSGAGRVDHSGRMIAASLTVLSVVMGETLLYAWWVAQANPGSGFSAEAGWRVYVRSWSVSPGDEIITMLFAVIGAWAASQALQRPRLGTRIENAADPGEEQRKAA